jgi:hypothetical protein
MKMTALALIGNNTIVAVAKGGTSKKGETEGLLCGGVVLNDIHGRILTNHSHEGSPL